MDLLLAPGDTLDITLEGGWGRHATVTAVDAPHVDLQFTGPDPVLPGDLTWCTAQIEWMTSAGAQASTSGIVHAVGRLLRLEVTGGTGLVQQRAHPRVRASVQVELTVGDRGFQAQTVDLSAGGMLLAGVGDLPTGTGLHFTLHLDETTVSGTGVVVRATPDGARGIRFDDHSRTIDEQLDHLRGAGAQPVG
jgi:hypothetical protein